MNDIRTQLPECPLAYEVPFIPATHTALVIPIYTADIDWQKKMLPWTLASLINNTNLIMGGVHLYIACGGDTEASHIRTALSNFDFAPDFDPICVWDSTNKSYDTVSIFDSNYWAFRDVSNTHKLDIGDTLKHNKIEAEPYPPLPKVSPSPSLYDMTHCTVEQFRHAIKHLMGAQLGITV